MPWELLGRLRLRLRLGLEDPLLSGLSLSLSPSLSPSLPGPWVGLPDPPRCARRLGCRSPGCLVRIGAKAEHDALRAIGLAGEADPAAVILEQMAEADLIRFRHQGHQIRLYLVGIGLPGQPEAL